MCRKLWKFVYLLAFTQFALIWYNWKSIYVHTNRFYAVFNDDNDRFDVSDVRQKWTDICEFPEINPWDSSIMNYLRSPVDLVCNVSQPYLTLVDYDGYLRFNDTELKQLQNDTAHSIECFCREFDSRGSGNRRLTSPVKLKRNLVEVRCTAISAKGKKLNDFYFNLHAHPVGNPSDVFQKSTETQLSVLFLGVDSVSMSQLKRYMPITYKFVTQEMGMTMFRKFNKIGDNTAPNMIAALSAKHQNNDFVMWKLFAQKGYAAVFNEDRPDLETICNFFSSCVQHYDYTPFYEAIVSYFKAKGISDLHYDCVRNVLVGDLFVDVIRRHTILFKDSLQFLFSFFVDYGHALNGDRIRFADKAYASFLNDSFRKGYLNKTFVILMSDHGSRFSDIRKTLVGALEERNPMLGLWFPDWFYEKHPKIKRNLILNSNRLTTPYDISETLQDILNQNYRGTQRSGSEKGLSLLYPIPANRNCDAAGIPSMYCLCLKYDLLNVNEFFLGEVALSLVNHLNAMLEEFVEHKCQKITLDEIIRGESLYSEVSKLRNDTNSIRISSLRIAIKTQPNDAIFEAMLTKKSESGRWVVDGEVQRLNMYRGTSNCVQLKLLKKYCTCKQNASVE